MRWKTWNSVIALGVFTALAVRGQLAAQDQPGDLHQYHHYQLVDLGTLGGPGAVVNVEPWQHFMTSNGTVAGVTDTSVLTPVPGCYNPIGNPDCFISHAFVWKDGNLEDLGTLPGGNYSFAAAIGERGQIAGTSENGLIDPFSGNPEFHAVLWQHERILDMGTLGGVSSLAEGMNKHGQITGVALNDVPDPYSFLGLGSGTTLTQTRGFLWQHGKMRDLGSLGGPDTWAVFVNDRGQVAGVSNTSYNVDPVTQNLPVGVFVWENGQMKDLGNLGGDNGLLPFYDIVNAFNNRGQVAGGMEVAGNQASHAFLWDGAKLADLGTLGGTGSFARGINDAGDVIGLANLPGDQTNHGFLWRNGAMTDLGTLNGDPCSDALTISAKGQVLGASQSLAGGCGLWTTAFLWEDGGPMVDLNALVPFGSGVQLTAGVWTNERGEILAEGTPPTCNSADGCGHTYILIPCDDNHPGIEGCDYTLVDAAAAVDSSQAIIIHRAGTINDGVISWSELHGRARQGLARQHRFPILASPNTQ